MLANDTRLRLVHALERAGELCVTDLAHELKMAPQAVSNQLQRLTDRRIVTFRREGSRLYYRIADPCVPEFLDLGLCLLEETGELPVGQGGKPDEAAPVLGAEASHRDRGRACRLLRSGRGRAAPTPARMPRLALCLRPGAA